MDSKTNWRATVENHTSSLLEQLTAQFETEIAHTQEAANRQTAEALNQTLRRLRHTHTEADTLQLIADAGGPWCERVAVVLVESNSMKIAASRGFPELAPGLAIAAGDAPALDACIAGTDPLSVLASKPELGAVLADAIGAESKAWLFPLVVREKTTGIVLAAGEVSPVAMELLAEAAGMRLEAQRTPPVAPAQRRAVHVIAQLSEFSEPAPRPLPAPPETAPQEERATHLLAQRVARVRVAEMRLADPELLEKAVFSGSIYASFREPIDHAREEFRLQHVAGTPEPVDYLHREILRSLAHGDERLLGADYPGPLV